MTCWNLIMTGSRCQKPLTTIIRVGIIEAGIVGFDEIMRRLAMCEWSGEQEWRKEL